MRCTRTLTSTCDPSRLMIDIRRPASISSGYTWDRARLGRELARPYATTFVKNAQLKAQAAPELQGPLGKHVHQKERQRKWGMRAPGASGAGFDDPEVLGGVTRRPPPAQCGILGVAGRQLRAPLGNGSTPGQRAGKEPHPPNPGSASRLQGCQHARPGGKGSVMRYPAPSLPPRRISDAVGGGRPHTALRRSAQQSREQMAYQGK